MVNYNANVSVNSIFANNYYFANGMAFVSGSGGGGSIKYTVANTSPTGNVAGDQWYQGNTDILYEYVNTGYSQFWLDISTKSATVYIGNSVSANGIPLSTPAVYANNYYFGNGSPLTTDTTSINKRAAAFAYIFG